MMTRVEKEKKIEKKKRQSRKLELAVRNNTNRMA